MIKTLLAILALALTTFAADVRFQWSANDPAENITHYMVYEVVPGGYVLKGTVAAPALTMTLTGVSSGVHVYVLAAKNVFAESDKGIPITDVIIPSAPKNGTVIMVVVPPAP